MPSHLSVRWRIFDEWGRSHSYHDTPAEVREALGEYDSLDGLLVKASAGQRREWLGTAVAFLHDLMRSEPLNYTGEVAEAIARGADNRAPIRGTVAPIEHGHLWRGGLDDEVWHCKCGATSRDGKVTEPDAN